MLGKMREPKISLAMHLIRLGPLDSGRNRLEEIM